MRTCTDRVEGNGLYDASTPKGQYTYDIQKSQALDNQVSNAPKVSMGEYEALLQLYEAQNAIGIARSAAADQYFLENGVSTVNSVMLVGSSNYVKAVNTVANETYPTGYTQGITITITGVAGARTVTYAP